MFTKNQKHELQCHRQIKNNIILNTAAKESKFLCKVTMCPTMAGIFAERRSLMSLSGATIYQGCCTDRTPNIKLNGLIPNISKTIPIPI